MSISPVKEVQKIVLLAFFATLIWVGALVAVPIGPVPITLQTLFIMLAGIILGPRAGTVTVLLYLIAGLVGLPVFSKGTGGFGVLLGPTGGYLIGFIGLAFCAGMGGRQKVPGFIGWLLLGNVLCFLPGVLWLGHVASFSLGKALAAGLYPFLPGAVAKFTVAILCWFALKKTPLLGYAQGHKS